MQIKPTPAWSHMTNTKVNYSTDTKKLIRLFRQEIYVYIIFNPLQISISWHAFGSNHSPEAVWIVSIRITHLGSALLLHSSCRAVELWSGCSGIRPVQLRSDPATNSGCTEI